MRKTTVHWEKYSICHQEYQRKLALDLANFLLQFIDDEKSENGLMNQHRYIDALIIKLNVLCMLCRPSEHSNVTDLRLEGKQTGYKLLAIVQQMNWRSLEAMAHRNIGFSEGLTKENYQVGIEHCQKAIEIYKSMGGTVGIKNAESDIARIKLKYDGT